MENTKVSIIIPVYNGEKYIDSTIKSCLEQRYDNIEVIVIDDKSSDSSRDLLSTFETIKVYNNDRNMGIAETLNKGIKLSSGEFILFLGQDDKLNNTHVENMLREFDEKTSFVYCNSIIIDSDDNVLDITYDDHKQFTMNKKIRYQLCMRNVVSSTGLLIRKSDLKKIKGWDTRYKNYGEWLLWIKLLSQGEARFSKSSRVYYRKHSTNITNTFSNSETKKLLDIYFEDCRNYAYATFKNDLNLVERIVIRLHSLLLPIKPVVKRIFN